MRELAYGKSFCAALLGLFFCAAALAQDPTKVEPTHYKLAFENEYVQVVNVHYGPHEKSSMANSVYERVMKTPRLQAIFDSDTHIDEFWRLPMNEQQATWGEPIELETLARDGMENFLL